MKELGYRFLRGVVAVAVSTLTESPYGKVIGAVLPVLGKGIRMLWPSTSVWLPF